MNSPDISVLCTYITGNGNKLLTSFRIVIDISSWAIRSSGKTIFLCAWKFVSTCPPIFQLLDTYAVGYALLFIGLCEVLVVAWRYGSGRLVENIERMLGPHRTLVVWKYIWLIVTPALLFFALIFMLIQLKTVTYGTYTFPSWADSFGWFLTCLSILPIPFYAVYKFISFVRTEGRGLPLLKSLKILSMPSEKWHPSLYKFRFDQD